MKFNKIFLTLIVGLGMASQAIVQAVIPLRRLTGRAIGETVVKLKKDIAQGPSQNTAEAYEAWKSDISKLLAQLVISKPNAEKLYGFDTTWPAAKAKYSLAKTPLTPISAEQVKKNFEAVLAELVETKKADPSALDLDEIVEDIEEDIEEVNQYLDISKLFEKSEKEAEEKIKEEEQKEEEEEEPLIAQEKQVTQSFFEQVKSVLAKPFTKTQEQKDLEDSLAQIDKYLAFLKQDYEKELPLKKDKEPVLPINEYRAALSSFENSLLGQVKNADFGSKEANKEAYQTAVNKIHNAYWELAKVQMDYANAITSALQLNAKNLASGNNDVNNLINALIKGDMGKHKETLDRITYITKGLDKIVDTLNKFLGFAKDEDKFVNIATARSILSASGKLNKEGTLPAHLRNDYNINEFQTNLKNFANNINTYYIQPIKKGTPFTKGLLSSINETLDKLSQLYISIEQSLPEKYAKTIELPLIDQ